MQMTQTQKRQFFEEGYLIVRGAIPKLMVEQARKAINREFEGLKDVKEEAMAV